MGRNQRARAQERRPRGQKRQQPGMVDPFTHEAEDVLLGVGGGILLDPVPHPPWQGRDVAANRRGGHAQIERRDVGGERAAAQFPAQPIRFASTSGREAR